MQKWEYLRLDIGYHKDAVTITANFDPNRTVTVKASELLNSLDRLGEQLWEMVSVFRSEAHEVYYFKRPVK